MILFVNLNTNLTGFQTNMFFLGLVFLYLWAALIAEYTFLILCNLSNRDFEFIIHIARIFLIITWVYA